MAGIRDVAKKANVSISTVSYALNGSTKVTEQTRQRIITIANDLNYIPNKAGRMLKCQKSKIVGVYFTNYGGRFYGELIEGMNHTFEMHGYEMIVCSGKKSHLFLPEQMIDGAIILDATFSDEEIIHYANQDYKIVVLDRKLDRNNICHVLLDNQSGAFMAIDALVKCNIDKICMITGVRNSYDNKMRLESACKRLDLYPKISYEIFQGDFSIQSGENAAKHIIENYSFEKPLAIFAFNDEMAIGVYRIFLNSPYRIGRDVYIIGFDHSEIGDYFEPPLSSIDYSKFKWGSIAAEKLLQMISNKSKIIGEQLISVSLTATPSIGTIKKEQFDGIV